MVGALTTFLAYLATFFRSGDPKDELTIVPFKDTGLFLVRITHGDTVVEELLPRGFEEWPKERMECDFRRIIVPKLKGTVPRAVRTGESRLVCDLDIRRIDKAEQRRVRRAQKGGIK